MFGKAEAGVMVQTPDLALQLLGGMSKLMMSAPGFWVRLFASSRASLRVHCDTKTRGSTSQVPLGGLMSNPSPVELTVKVLAWAGLAPSTRPINAVINKASTKRATVDAHFFSTRMTLRVAIPGMLVNLLALSSEMGRRAMTLPPFATLREQLTPLASRSASPKWVILF
jgi:hypothetical protein